jgi:hypothetical protein
MYVGSVILALRATKMLMVVCFVVAQSAPDQSIQVFSLVISLVTIGSVIVTINAKLLGGRV